MAWFNCRMFMLPNYPISSFSISFDEFICDFIINDKLFFHINEAPKILRILLIYNYRLMYFIKILKIIIKKYKYISN